MLSFRNCVLVRVLIFLFFFQIVVEGFHLQRLSSSSLTGKNEVKQLRMTSKEDEGTIGQAVIGASGVAANLVCDYSLYVLKTTGCGLPPGPFGLVGAIEGISYLGIVGILGWSLITKVSTGKGLPAGPNGLLGASEGLTFLTVIGGLIVAGLNLQQYGYLPGFLPDSNCYAN